MDKYWRERAKCRGDIDFLARIEKTPLQDRSKAAEEACAGCPTIRECALSCFGVTPSGRTILQDIGVVRAGVLLPLHHSPPGSPAFEKIAEKAGLWERG